MANMKETIELVEVTNNNLKDLRIMEKVIRQGDMNFDLYKVVRLMEDTTDTLVTEVTEDNFNEIYIYLRNLNRRTIEMNTLFERKLND